MLNRPAPSKDYWPRNLFLVGILLLIWLVVSFMPLGFDVLPHDWTILGWPLSFALTAFGIPLVYLALIGVYATIMSRRDKQAQAQASADSTVGDDPKS